MKMGDKQESRAEEVFLAISDLKMANERISKIADTFSPTEEEVDRREGCYNDINALADGLAELLATSKTLDSKTRDELMNHLFSSYVFTCHLFSAVTMGGNNSGTSSLIRSVVRQDQ